MQQNPQPTRNEATPNTFDSLLSWYHEYLRGISVDPSSVTAKDSLLQLMSSVGELATFSTSSASPTSDFEYNEIENIIGAMALSVAVVGNVYGIDPGEAAKLRIQRLCRKHGKQSSSEKCSSPNGQRGNQHQQPKGEHLQRVNSADSSSSSLKQHRPPNLSLQEKGESPRAAAAEEGVQSQTSPPEAPLSPGTVNGFYPMIDIIERSHPSAAEISALGLSFVVPQSNGALLDLKPNGSNIRVTAQNWAEFLELMKPFRLDRTFEQGTPQTETFPVVASNVPQPQQSPEQQFITRRVEVPHVQQYDPNEVEKMFSPNHWEKDLFSPHSNMMSFNIQYPEQQPVASGSQQGHSQRGQQGQPPVMSPQRTAQAPPIQQPAPPQPHQPQMQQLTQIDPHFMQKIQALERKEVQGGAIAQLHLNFTIPYNGQSFELFPRGSQIPVTSSNCDTFLQLVRDKKQELDGRIQRTSSMRTLAVSHLECYDPRTADEKFSPSHFQRDLFAPHSTNTTFNVDYDLGGTYIPPALQQKKILMFPTPSHYVEHIAGRADTFQTIFKEVCENPTSLQRYQVTWCVPSMKGAGVEDLIPEGRNLPVRPQDLPRFRSMVMEKRVF